MRRVPEATQRRLGAASEPNALAVVMGGFRFLLRISPRRAKAQCGQGIEGSLDPIGIACEKHNF